MTRGGRQDRRHDLVAGRYRLLEMIGRGGMGQVWRAHDEVLGRTVAVKEMGGLLASDSSYMAERYERARREARAAARIDHPNVVRIYDVVDEADRLWIVMEFLTGPSLATVMESGPVDAWKAVWIGLELATALSHVHAAGVVHRDVKPGNVHLELSDRVVLMDFGIAALAESENTTLTSTGAVVGTIGYMAPERLRAKPLHAASDLWSLGATLYHAVLGRAPFERHSVVATLTATVTEPVEVGEAAGPLRPLLISLLDKDPKRRPTANELVVKLTELSRQAPSAEKDAMPRAVPSAVPTGQPVTDPTTDARGVPADTGSDTRAQTIRLRTDEPPRPTVGADPADPAWRFAATLSETAPEAPRSDPPRPDPSVPRSYIPRKPTTAFARQPHRSDGQNPEKQGHRDQGDPAP